MEVEVQGQTAIEKNGHAYLKALMQALRRNPSGN